VASELALYGRLMGMTVSRSLFLVSLMRDMWMLKGFKHKVLVGWVLSVSSLGHTWEESSYRIG
jgi:hypothetical protein